MGIIKIITKAEAEREYLLNCYRYIVGGHTLPSYYGVVNVDPDFALEQMMTVKKYFGKLSGNQLVHFIISFDRKIDDAYQAWDLGYKIADYYRDRYQIVFGVHENHRAKSNGKSTSYYHIHMMLNSVSFVDGKMFADNWSDIYSFRDHIQKVTGDNKWLVVLGHDKSEVDL